MIQARPRTFLSPVPEGWGKDSSTYQKKAVQAASQAVKATSRTLIEQERRFAARLEADRLWAKREGLL